ncbi:hypothetical protein INR49_004866, partial [Caranx melampygus]
MLVRRPQSGGSASNWDPKEWRKRVWLTLADQYLHSISIDWDKTLRFAFNERSNPDDDSLGIQIVKDGCSSYCGQEGEQDRVVLKRVLLAYARWNKAVGYCQGFNVLAALILEDEGSGERRSEVVETHSVIYLIDKVLPESYFAKTFELCQRLLRLKLPRLSQHLHHLQKAANREAGGSYEPPLTNVFTMQWFLTMFATCCRPTVLKIWDSVFFEGSEVLFRVALAIWRDGREDRVLSEADEFYSTMGCHAGDAGRNLIDPAELMQLCLCGCDTDEHVITAVLVMMMSSSCCSGGLGSGESDDDADMDDEDSVVTALG